jgi:hypothetical protein
MQCTLGKKVLEGNFSSAAWRGPTLVASKSISPSYKVTSSHEGPSRPIGTPASKLRPSLISCGNFTTNSTQRATSHASIASNEFLRRVRTFATSGEF